MGRRFPTIRLKSKDKKDAKKISACFSASDKAVEVNGAKGSCVRAASAIYSDELPSPQHEDFESNIYENGHIVMKKDVIEGSQMTTLEFHSPTSDSILTTFSTIVYLDPTG